jgi:flagellin
MSVDSVNTNMGAMVALQALTATQSQLAVTQRQISTGYRVATSTDDGAAYAIAMSVRSSVGALTSANQQLGTMTGLLTTTQSALNDINTAMSSMRDVLVKLSSNNLSASARSEYATQYSSFATQIQTFIKDANYNGANLISGYTSEGNGTFERVAIARNETGATYGVGTYGASGVYTSLLAVTLSTANNNTGATAAAAVATYITAGGTFVRQQASIGLELNTIGAAVNYVNDQVSYNNDKIDALNSGLGALVDADLAKESAQLTSLQIRQQLGTQSLSMANQAPQTLLSLFR